MWDIIPKRDLIPTGWKSHIHTRARTSFAPKIITNGRNFVKRQRTPDKFPWNPSNSIKTLTHTPRISNSIERLALRERAAILIKISSLPVRDPIRDTVRSTRITSAWPEQQPPCVLGGWTEEEMKSRYKFPAAGLWFREQIEDPRCW